MCWEGRKLYSVRDALNGPRRAIAIDDGAVHGEESAQVLSHAEDLVSARDELGYGCYTVVWEIAL